MGGTLKVTAGDLGDIALEDYDGDGNPAGQETIAEELDGLAASGARVSISYHEQPRLGVDGFSVL